MPLLVQDDLAAARLRRMKLTATALLAVAAGAGAAFYLRSSSAQVVVVQQLPSAPAPAAAVSFSSAAASPALSPAKAGEYQTATAGTTLVTVLSTPTGAEVHDADDRLLGLTPFDLSVPSAKPLQRACPPMAPRLPPLC